MPKLELVYSKRPNDPVPFSTLEPGEVFRSPRPSKKNDPTLYICVTRRIHNEGALIERFAVSLRSGQARRMPKDETVVRMKAQVRFGEEDD